MPISPGSIALLGSGETSLAGGRIYESLAAQLDTPLRIAVMETPAGFELNSPQVAGRVADFLLTRLGNYKPNVQVVPARKRGSPYSPEDPALLAPLRQANFIFMGPGSPTYAIRQLQGSLAWQIILARHRLGAALVFASAATISVSAWAVPVYEIYKVGQDVHALPGLNLLEPFGATLSFVPHWNNTDGGAEVDTSRCFIGMERFAEWCNFLPPHNTTLGLDEHTGLLLDFAKQECRVSGVSSVSLLRTCDPKMYPSGASFPFSELGLRPPETLPDLPPAAWEMAQDFAPAAPPDQVVRLAQQRQQARAQKDWRAADDLRAQIQAQGWAVQDTPSGFQLQPL